MRHFLLPGRTRKVFLTLLLAGITLGILLLNQQHAELLMRVKENFHQLSLWWHQHPVWFLLGFLGTYILLNALFLPGGGVCVLLAGAITGPYWGIPLVTFGYICGVGGGFLLARPGSVLEADVLSGASNARVSPMQLSAKVTPGNTIYITRSGAERHTLWLSPEIVDFNSRLSVRLRSRQPFNDFVQPQIETILEDLRIRGDRQRLYWAKIDIN